MTTQDVVPPKYNPELTERAVMEVVIEAHPAFLTTAGLVSSVAVDPQDRREVDTIASAIRGLKDWGLLQDSDRKRLEPTPAALRFASLLLR